MNKDFAQKCVRSTSGKLINIYIIFEFCAVEDCVNFLKLGRFPGFLLYTKKLPISLFSQPGGHG